MNATALSSMIEGTVAVAMKPLPIPITLDRTAADARTRMRSEGVEFLPVISPADETLPGVVLFGALERGGESNGQ